MKIKPPIGVEPKYIHESTRTEELAKAINRYTNAGLKVPIAWVKEYNELIVKYGNY